MSDLDVHWSLSVAVTFEVKKILKFFFFFFFFFKLNAKVQIPKVNKHCKKLKLNLKNKEKITKMICYTNAYEPRTENFLSYFAPKQGKNYQK